MAIDIPSASFYAPTEQELIRGAEEALRIKKYANLDSYNVRIFDMSNSDDVSSYTEIMKDILNGISSKTHFVWAKERTLVNGVWKIFLEWSVYSFSESPKNE